MAAEPQPDWLSCLPSSWSYGVVRDGRIFFINEQAQSTTWLHPVSGEAVVTGHRKTPDLPTGWEEGYTFEGARCFINHNERKVTCKHPVSGAPSQDNCIFVVNEQPAPKSSSDQSSDEMKERPTSLMSEVSHQTGGSDLSTFPGSPATSTGTAPCNALGLTSASTAATRPSRSSKKLHNFGKRSNSIRRNLNAPVVKRGWLYKQDSTGMKLWKKRWFVLSDMCLFYYRDDKEDNVLGSILLPSFHISMLSVDDHISRKYAFKATHPNMRTYYFCSDASKDMESWMKVMTDAALVHSEPLRRLDKVNADLKRPEELNNVPNHQALTCPEITNNERNREPTRQPSCSRADGKQGEKRDYYTLHRDGERYLVKKDGVSYMLQKDGEKYILHKDGEQFLLRKNGEKYCLQKEEQCAVHRDLHKYSTLKNDTLSPTENKYTPGKDGHKLLPPKDIETCAAHTQPLQQTDKYVPVKEVRRALSLRETDRSCMYGNNRYGTIHVMDRYGTLKEVKKYSTLREGDRYTTLRDVDKYATLRDPDKYGFHRDRSAERPKISIQLQPAQAAAIAAAVSASRSHQSKVNGSMSAAVDQSDGSSRLHLHTPVPPTEIPSGAGLSRSNSIPPMDPWARAHRPREDDTTSVTSYQTLPRNMPSHRTPIVPRYPEGYRTLPRNSMCRPESVCAVSSTDKRRSIKDDTMWQLYEWQQRQAYSRLSLAPPTGAGHYGTLPSTKTMSHLCESVAPSIPTSPSHGSIYSTLPPPRQKVAPNPGSPHSELSSPVFTDSTLGRQKTHPHKLGFPTERYSAAGLSPHNITPQTLQGKTISPDTFKNVVSDAEDADIDTKLSRLCEQDKLVRTQEEKVQQLHREKHTLETALLSASQELSEQIPDSATSQSLLQQRDVLQGGLLSTCRELNRVTAELHVSRREYERLEGDVSQAKANLLQQLEALGSPQTEPPSQRHIQIQKELWRIQDVMEALAKNKPQPATEALGGFPGSKPLSSISKNEQAPDYRLYKSEPELTTVKEEETDEPHSEERGGTEAERRDAPLTKVTPCPVGIVPPRTKCTLSPPESTTIASYVTLRKTKKPEPRAERPRSAMDQMVFGERELGRIRMSVEEQLERMRRNQEASTLRRSKLSRSASFGREQTPVTPQSQPQTEGTCTDPYGLEAALQRLKDLNKSVTDGGNLSSEQEIQTAEEDKDVRLRQPHGDSERPKTFTGNSSPDSEECERQTAVILQFSPEPQRVEIVELQPFEDVSSSATNTPTDNSFQTTEPEMSSPEPREEQCENSRDTSQGSPSDLKMDDIQLNKNSILPAQTVTLVSSDT